MKDNKKKKDHSEDIYDSYYNISAIAGTLDMTGLTPSIPEAQKSAVSYAKLYGLPVPEALEEGKYRLENKKNEEA